MLLITGITGHSGKFFLNELEKNSFSEVIRCVVREDSNSVLLDQSKLKIEKVTGDLSDLDFLSAALNGVRTVFHIASIFYSEKIVQAALINNVTRVVLVHTTGIFSKFKSASSEYQRIENKIKSLVKGSKTKILILRPTMIYGNIRDKNMIIFIKLIDFFRLFPIINNGKSLIQPVNGRDLGRVYYQILMRPEIAEGDYILSGEKPMTMKALFCNISKMLGKKTYFINVPLKVAVFLAKLVNFFSFNFIDYVEKVLRMGENRNFSHWSAKRDFGYNPMPFDDGLRIEIDEYKRSK